MELTEVQVGHVLDLARLGNAKVDRNFYGPLEDEPGLAIEVDNLRELSWLSAAIVRALGNLGQELVRDISVLNGDSVVAYWPGVKVKAGI